MHQKSNMNNRMHMITPATAPAIIPTKLVIVDPLSLSPTVPLVGITDEDIASKVVDAFSVVLIEITGVKLLYSTDVEVIDVRVLAITDAAAIGEKVVGTIDVEVVDTTDDEVVYMFDDKVVGKTDDKVVEIFDVKLVGVEIDDITDAVVVDIAVIKTLDVNGDEIVGIIDDEVVDNGTANVKVTCRHNRDTEYFAAFRLQIYMYMINE